MTNSSPLLAAAVIALVLSGTTTAGCSPGGGQGSAREASAKSAVPTDAAITEEAAIYTAALDSLIEVRAPLWGGSRQDSVHVLSTIYWWPMVQLDGTRGAALGPVPMMLPSFASRNGLAIRLQAPDSVIALGGKVTAGVPVVVLGPIDFFGPGEAWLRACIYLGPNGQEMYRIRLTRGALGWKALTIQIELQS